MKKIIIASISANGVIGHNNKIPWHIKSDLVHFKETTIGYPVIMGRKTFESIGKVLVDRMNIVLTRRSYDKPKNDSNLVYALNLSEAYDLAAQLSDKVYIIGGGNVFEQTIDIADEMIITFLKTKYEGDVYFPFFFENDWNKSEIANANKYVIYKYSRRVK